MNSRCNIRVSTFQRSKGPGRSSYVLLQYSEQYFGISLSFVSIIPPIKKNTQVVTMLSVNCTFIFNVCVNYNMTLLDADQPTLILTSTLHRPPPLPAISCCYELYFKLFQKSRINIQDLIL